jgi:predicted nucleic acid-binding protein
MRFWDSSAVLPMLVIEPTTSIIRQLLQTDSAMAVWWGTLVECSSGISRLRREDRISIAEESAALELLDTVAASWLEILPGEPVRSSARRLLRVHSLRAADALQLAAALECRSGAGVQEFVTFDERLANAARLEGFHLPF